MRARAPRSSSFAGPRLPAANVAAAGPLAGPARSPSLSELHAGGDLPGVEVAHMGMFLPILADGFSNEAVGAFGGAR